MLTEQTAMSPETVMKAALECYSEDQIKHFAFNPDQFLLSRKTRHLPLCGYCQERVARWLEYVRRMEKQMMTEQEGRVSLN